MDDIVYNPANLKFGAISRNKYGNAVFSPIYVTYEVNKSLALPSYVEMYVTRDTFIQNALQYQQGTVYERMSVNTEDFATLEIMLPSKNEQRVIGEFFDNLDNLITLHQRKCDETKKLKKYMLQKMFPKNGERFPEIRFSGFTDAWEQRKLSELTDYSNGTGHEEYVVAQGKYELITLKSISSEGELVTSEKYVDEEFETLKQGNALIMMLSEQAKGMLGMTTNSLK